MMVMETGKVGIQSFPDTFHAPPGINKVRSHRGQWRSRGFKRLIKHRNALLALCRRGRRGRSARGQEGRRAGRTRGRSRRARSRRAGGLGVGGQEGRRGRGRRVRGVGEVRRVVCWRARGVGRRASGRRGRRTRGRRGKRGRSGSVLEG